MRFLVLECPDPRMLTVLRGHARAAWKMTDGRVGGEIDREGLEAAHADARLRALDADRPAWDQTQHLVIEVKQQ